ncbi:MAG: YraN family protein [Lentisphaerae bacterium]|nr:YraN family protein [Lentisphaerota bacterium]
MFEAIQRFFRRFGKSEPGGDSGLWGERIAEDALKAKGFRILGRRVRVGRRDEFDLVARDGDTLVFVEVKTRESELFGRPMESVNAHKRHVLSRAAVRYLKAIKTRPPSFRFDVVEVIGIPGEPPEEIRHIENAFPLDRRYRVP